MASPRKTWVGQELAGGRYSVDGLLGEGGMGQVYRARDRNIDADVVIKVPHRSMLEQADFAARFTREIRSLVKLSHPQIVKVTDVGEHDGLPFAVMQHLPGGDLEARRPPGAGGRPGPVAPRSLSTWLPGVASALDYIHRERYIHRDVKPANILFDAQGHPFLSDFGVAKVLGSVEATSRREPGLTGAGLVLGTPEYMAPELIMGKEFDGRVDQYALAVSAYEMLCGRKPFDGHSMTAILVRQTSEAPPAMAELSGAGADEAARVVFRGLAKDPAQRYATCLEFAKALVSVTSRMSAPANATPPAAGQLCCPACSRGIPVPAAVLAAPERARGRKTACPACRAALRFAETGLSLVLEGQASQPAPSTVIAMAPGPSVDRPSPIARTVAVEPGVPPTQRAATVRIESMPELQPPKARPAGTMLISQPIETNPAPVPGTVQIESLSITNPRRRTPTNRTIPIAAAAVVVVAALAVGYSTLVPKSPLARPEPPPSVVPVITTKAVRPVTEPPRIEIARNAPPAIPKQPAAPPAPARDVPAPAPEEMTPEKPATPTIEGPGPENPPRPEAPAVARPSGKVLTVSLDDVAKRPQDYLGQLILPTEMLWIGREMTSGGGTYQRLSVEKSLPSIKKGQHAESPLAIVADRELAANFQQAIDRFFDRSAQQNRAIADLRVIKDPYQPGSYLGVVERAEVFHSLDDEGVYKKAWGRAFRVALITPDGMHPGYGRGDAWKSRIEGSLLSHSRQGVKAGIQSGREAIFDLAMQQAAKLANDANKVRDAQIELERRRSPGVNNFPAPR